MSGTTAGQKTSENESSPKTLEGQSRDSGNDENENNAEPPDGDDSTKHMRFDGKVALVTGAGGGLGRQFAKLLALRGARVVANDVGCSISGRGTSIAPADATVEEIRKAGGAALANHDSVADGAKVVKAVMDAYGRIDIVVTCAGILRDKTFRKMSEEDWDLQYQFELRGVYSVLRAAWPHLEKNKYGRIVNLSSTTGLYGGFGQANSAAFKSAILGLTFTLALEGQKRNVKVNCVAPVGASRILETVRSREDLDRLPAHTIANLVAALCHDSCEITGAVFESGGHWVSRVALMRSRGVRFPAGFSPEDVVAKLPEVCDLSQGCSLANTESMMSLSMEGPLPAPKRESGGPSKL